MEEKYNLELEYFYFNLAKLKESQIHKINSMINNGRMIDQMTFYSYGKAYFDQEDPKHSHLLVDLVDKYDKNKVNCLVYDLKQDYKNEGYYDKLFIYVNQLKEQYYGYVLYNSKNNHGCQKILIDLQEDFLINKITTDFLSMFKRDIYEYFSKRYDSIKAYKNDTTVKVQNLGDYNKMIQKHKDKQKIGYY